MTSSEIELPMKRPSEGYFFAKRYIVGRIDIRMATVEEQNLYGENTKVVLEEMKKLREMIRSGLLWDCHWGS